MMVETVVVWGLLMLCGFALIYWPSLGEGIQASSGSTPTDFWSAFYYSGYSFTTLGTGDLVPKTAIFRILMVVQAWIGFAVLTLTLTYLMSVYSALVRRNTLAQVLHHMTGGTADPVELVGGLAGGGPESASSQLMDLGARILNLLESHHSYPILHYFRMRDPRYAMSRIAYIALETATLIDEALGSQFDGLKRSAGLKLLSGSGRDLLEQTSSSFLKGAAKRNVHRDDRQSFNAAICKLDNCGIDTVHQGRATGYSSARSKWFPTVEAFAELMAYRMDEIVPHQSSSDTTAGNPEMADCLHPGATEPGNS